MKNYGPNNHRLLTAVLPALVLAAAGITSTHASLVLGRWNLGEQDLGATAGSPGGVTTVDATNAANMNLMGGAPTYSADVPTGGSTLSMNLASGDWYSSSAVTAISTMDLNNFSIQFDVKPTATGPFPTAVCIGRYGSGAAFIYHAGGTWRFHIGGVGDQISGPVTMNAWQNIQFRREGGVNKLFINGSQVGGTTTTAFTPSTDFTIGAPLNGGGGPDTGGYFIGLVDNVVLTDLSAASPPTISGAPTASPGKIYAGNSIILSASVIADPAGKTYLWRKGGVVVAVATNTPTFINGVTTNQSGNYDVIVTNNYGAATSSVVAVTVLPSGGADVMKFRMGDNDPGAAAGNPGNAQTVDAILGNNLDATSTSYYSNNVSVGGGTLSLAFDGFSSFYRNTNLTTFLANLDQANYSLSADVYCSGLGGAGFSFPFSLGRNGGGIGIVEIGGTWYLIRMGMGTTPLGPVELNTWTHFEIQRRDFDTQARIRVFVNGQDANFQTTTYSVAGPILTTGANTVGDGVNVEGYFNGLVDNVVIHNYSIGALPTITSGPTALPDANIATGEPLTLTATMSGGTPASFRWRRNGTVLTNDVTGTTSAVLLPTPLAGNYDVIVSNSPQGVVTSSIVAVTIDPRTEGAFKATYNLGEQDPGAANGVAGNAVTRQLDGLKDLARFGTPSYTDVVPPGGSTLAMSLNGSTDWYGVVNEGRWAQFLTNQFNPNNFSMSCDAYPTGDGAAGFSIALSLGTPGNNYFIYHAGGTWYVHKNGTGNIITGPAVALNAWTHLELVRKNFGAGVETHLLVNGTDVGSTGVGINPTPAFTIGANRRNAPLTDPNPFEGPFKGYLDNVVLSSPGTTITLTLVSGLAQVDCTGKADTTYRLLVSPDLSPGSWTEVTSGMTDANGYVQLWDFTPPTGRGFYRLVTP